MSRTVTMSPLGLYKWDSTIFDLMEIPSELDKDILIDNILAETAELEVLYPNPTVFKNLLGVWSAKQLHVWEKLFATTQFEYNPIENYDRQETGSDGGSGSTTHSGTDNTSHSTTHTGTQGKSGTLVSSGTDSLDMTRNGNASDTTTGTTTKGHWIAGYDSTPSSAEDDGLVKQNKDEDSVNSSVTRTSAEINNDTTTYGKTDTDNETITYGDTVSESGSITHGEAITSTNTGTHTLRAHGNIGVTTTQEMIKQEREIDSFNIYDIIINDFKMRFCILVY